MRLPNGVSTQTRQSPSSSRQRSITTCDRRAPSRWHLPVGEKAQQILRRAGIEIVLGHKPRQRRGLGQRAQFAHQRADAAAKLQRTSRPIALPERHLARLAGRRRHQHAVVRDLLNAPRRRAQDKRLAGMALEDHLFVEFAHAHGFAFAVGQKNTIQAAVGNGTGIQYRQSRRSVARRDHVAHAVPGEPRTQFGKLVGGIAPTEQIEHAFKRRAAQAAEGRGMADELVKRIHADLGLRRSPLASLPYPNRRTSTPR